MYSNLEVSEWEFKIFSECLVLLILESQCLGCGGCAPQLRSLKSWSRVIHQIGRGIMITIIWYIYYIYYIFQYYKYTHSFDSPDSRDAVGEESLSRCWRPRCQSLWPTWWWHLDEEPSKCCHESFLQAPMLKIVTIPGHLMPTLHYHVPFLMASCCQSACEEALFKDTCHADYISSQGGWCKEEYLATGFLIIRSLSLLIP